MTSATVKLARGTDEPMSDVINTVEVPQACYYCEPVNYQSGKYFSEYNTPPVTPQDLPFLNKEKEHYSIS